MLLVKVVTVWRMTCCQRFILDNDHRLSMSKSRAKKLRKRARQAVSDMYSVSSHLYDSCDNIGNTVGHTRRGIFPRWYVWCAIIRKLLHALYSIFNSW